MPKAETSLNHSDPDLGAYVPEVFLAWLQIGIVIVFGLEHLALHGFVASSTLTGVGILQAG